MFIKFQAHKLTAQVALACVVLIVLAAAVSAQSLDPSTPAPIRSNNLIGKIAARDLGDSRVTDHYYAFIGVPGDLLITIKSRNLNGDLDVFTAGTLRPLLKITLYAENTTPVTKGIYLRKREDLILRIEARSPNDDEGTYQLSFSGSFSPIAGGADIADNETAATDTSSANPDRKTKRVSSVGARLPEPEVPATEVAATPKPEPTPAPAVEEAKPEEKPAAKTKSPTVASSPRGRRPAGRRTVPPSPKPQETETSGSNNTKPDTGEVVETPKATTSAPRTATRRRGATTTARAAKPKVETPAEPVPAPEPESGPRLVIETNDGTLINRSMSSVRRVIVENGQVVVTGKDGKIDRIPLVNVLRMSIAQ